MMVPSGHAAVLPAETPVIGDLAAIDQAASFAADVVGDCASYEASLRSASDLLTAASGAAVAQVLGKLDETLPSGARTLQQSADTAKTGFAMYSSEVESIQRRARTVQDDIDRCLGVIRAEAAVIEGIAAQIRCRVDLAWHSPPSTAMPMPVLDPSRAAGMDAVERDAARRAVVVAHEEEWRRAATSWIGARDGIRDACATWEHLIAERKISETALVATLHDTALGHLISVGSGPGAPGPKYTIAHAVSGELWGVGTSAPEVDALVRLLDGEPAPAEVARLWAELEASGVDTDALLRRHCFELAALDGLPFAAMDRAGRAALAHALDPDQPQHAQEAFVRMGFVTGERSPAEFREDLEAVRRALDEADARAAMGEEVVQLVALGRHDGAATAGISMGDLDEAPTVGVFVSGMKSDVRGLADAFDAFRSIRAGEPGIAMVTWTGYRSPGLVEETFQSRADAGGEALASFLDGIAAQRDDNPAERLTIIAHSYGTNVVAEALKRTEASVSAFVTLGSAGLKYGTTVEDLGVDEIYATHAQGDGIAEGIGQHLHFRSVRDGGGIYEARVDPRDLDGAREFSSESTAEGEAVTMHNLMHPIDWPVWLQGFADAWDGTAAADEVGYLNERSSTVNGMRNIMRDESR